MAFRQRAYGKAGAYLVINHIDHSSPTLGYPGLDHDAMVVRSKRGKGTNKVCYSINPTYRDQQVNYEFEFLPEKGVMRTEQGEVDFTFADTETVLYRCQGKDVGLILDNEPSHSYWDHCVELANKDGQHYFIFGNYGSKVRFLAYALKGTITIEQNYHGDMYLADTKNLISKMHCTGDDEIVIVVREIVNNCRPFEMTVYDFDECAANNKNEFEEFYNGFKEVKDEYKAFVKHCAYIYWIATVLPSKQIDRKIVLGNVIIDRTYKYENGLSSMGLAYGNPRLAYDSLACFFSMADEYGCLPGAFSDITSSWYFMKAPNDGLFFQYVEKQKEYDDEQKTEVYQGLSKQVDFWMNCHDSNQDGICEYVHGNDSDMDNMTVFDDHVATDSPCLTAYMINNMDYLSDLAMRLGKKEEAKVWKDKADNLMKKALEYFFDEDGHIIARKSLDGSVIRSQSTELYFFLILRKRIPQEYRDIMVKQLVENYGSEYGMVTEPHNSPLYDPLQRTFFRGCIFYQPVLIQDALDELGEHEFAKKMAEGYVKLSMKSDIFDFYNSVTALPHGDWGSTAQTGAALHCIYRYLND